MKERNIGMNERTVASKNESEVLIVFAYVGMQIRK